MRLHTELGDKRLYHIILSSIYIPNTKTSNDSLIWPKEVTVSQICTLQDIKVEKQSMITSTALFDNLVRFEVLMICFRHFFMVKQKETQGFVAYRHT